jgi:hypothetical protein
VACGTCKNKIGRTVEVSVKPKQVGNLVFEPGACYSKLIIAGGGWRLTSTVLMLLVMFTLPRSVPHARRLYSPMACMISLASIMGKATMNPRAEVLPLAARVAREGRAAACTQEQKIMATANKGLFGG